MAHRVNNDSDSSHSPAASILLKLIEDYHSFNPSREVPVLPYPTPLEFSKQVGRGRPCVYRLDPNDQPPPTGNDEIDEDEEDEKVRNRLTKDEMKNILSCSAFSWTRQSMCEKVKEDVEVAVTPDGRADSLYRLPRPQSRRGFYNEEKDEDEDEDEEAEEVFVQPATIKMSLSTLFDKLLIPQDDDEEEDDDEYEEESTTTTTTSIGTNSTNVNRRRHEKRQKDTKQYYLQSQNSNLTTTSSSLSPLLEDLPRRHLPFAGPVLGQPEAVNIWIGGSGSVTSTHRDPYENLYLVLKGCKTFTLYPPVEELCLHAKRVRTGRHVLVDSGDNKREKEFEIVLDDDIQQQEQEKSAPETETDTDTDTEYDNKIPWIPIDPDTINFSSSDTSAKTKYHYYKYSNPIKVKVWENEILYLPSGWFHHVRQECGVWDDDGQIAPCIAVNYWYDMDYEGEKYATREMMTRLVETVRREEQR